MQSSRYIYTTITLAIAIVILVLGLSCNATVHHEKFSKSKWVDKDDLDYQMRDAVLDDLLAHHKLKGLTYTQLIDSLGEPANYGDIKDSVYYDVVVNYGYLDPKSGKYLVFSLSKDSIVTGFKVVQWHNRHVNE